MIRHYWKSAIRNLFRNKLFTTINVIGLSLSIAIFLTLSAYVSYQFSYDLFYNDVDRIYRVNYYEYQEGQAVLETARTHDRTALLLHEYLPEAEAVARVYNEKAFVFTEDVRHVDQDMLFADSSFLSVFDLKLISGSKEDGLKPPHTVMVSRSQAELYFPGQDPMGKILYFNEHLPFTITGVFEDIPATSSIDFDFLLSWSTLPYNGWVTRDGTFNVPWTFTFVKLKQNAKDIPSLNAALSRMANDHITHLKQRGHTARYELTPLTDLHTAAPLSGEIKPTANKTLLYALMSLGIFLLVAAWVNYVNLSISRLLERAEEIGVRKVFGASRFAISGQFLLEAILLSVCTFAIGFSLYVLFTGRWSQYLFTSISFLRPTYVTTLLYLAVFIAATTLIAFYPAYFVSRFKPVFILKNRFGSARGRTNYLHHGLMVFQLFLAVTVVGITLIAGKQISFVRGFDTGFNTKQTISLYAPASTNSDSLRSSRYRSFRNEVLQTAGFRYGTASMNIPGQEIRFHDEDVRAVGSTYDRKQSFRVMMVDEGYIETFGLTLTAGKNFNEKETGNTCLINQSAAIALGYNPPEDALNTDLMMSENKRATVTGVVKDYHHESVRKPVEPIIFVHRHPWEYGYYSFQVESRDGTFLTTLNKIWDKHYPNDQFIYYFLDSFFAEQYREDQLFGTLLKVFSIISVSIASLGLFGMASLAMVKRTKEIAVRKVLGATVGNLLVLLSFTYIKLILIGCALAFPLAYYLMQRWLEGFSYKIAIQWWMILLPGLIVLLTTLITIAGHSLRAATANPADSLRDQ
jgi:putative ABC transport system permease protein